MTIRSVYVASAFADYQRTRAAQAVLRAGGLGISFDWTTAADEYPDGDAAASPDARHEAAIADGLGVVKADALLFLTPAEKSQGCGCWVELGIAMARGKRVVITGPQRDRTIFCELAERFDTDAAGIARLFSLAGAT
jgi:hypothetical protein